MIYFLINKDHLRKIIARGSVKNLKIEILNDLDFKKGNFNFFADKNDILIKNIFGELENVKISEGDIKLNLENGININSNFNSNIKSKEKFQINI